MTPEVSRQYMPVTSETLTAECYNKLNQRYSFPDSDTVSGRRPRRIMAPRLILKNIASVLQGHYLNHRKVHLKSEVLHYEILRKHFYETKTFVQVLYVWLHSGKSILCIVTNLPHPSQWVFIHSLLHKGTFG